MKLLQNADIRFSQPYLDQDEYANVRIVKNGSRVVLTHQSDAKRPAERLDRLFAASWEDKGNKSVVITGRSEFLEKMGVPTEEQQVTIVAKGGDCETCRGGGVG